MVWYDYHFMIGVPDDRVLEDGDIINIDTTLYYKGFHGVTSKTFVVGNVDHDGMVLVHKTREALQEAIRVCGPGIPISRIGDKIQDFVDLNTTFSIVRDFCGHGIGETFHQAPLIQHFKNDDPGIMQVGMVFTIGACIVLDLNILEPILTQGESDYITAPDGWTILSKDGGRSAQFEHTILITDNGHLVLTA